MKGNTRKQGISETPDTVALGLVAEPIIDKQNVDETLSIFFDQYSRYKSSSDILCGLLTSTSETVLDIGSGESCLLSQFVPANHITYIDPLINDEKSDTITKIHGDFFGDLLQGKSFDYVITIDTFEHIPADFRDEFLSRAFSIAKKGVIIACPCSEGGTAEDVDSHVNGVYHWFSGQDYHWLHEHFEYGLPSSKAITAFFDSKDWFVQTFGNGHAPWIKELLPFVITTNEMPGLENAAQDLHMFFNRQLYQYDHCGPSYRQIFVATKANETVNREALSHLPAEAQHKWDELQDILRNRLLFQLKDLSEKQTAQQTEIVRLNKLLKEVSDWGKSATHDIEIRDKEILRLQARLSELTQGGA